MGIADQWAALQFDNAITFAGRVIEHALHERRKIGEGKNARWENVYTIAQILDKDFRLPRPPSEEDKDRAGAQAFIGMAGVRVVRKGQKVTRN